MKRDGAGHLYTEVENVRITYVPADDRSDGADWSGQDVIRLQAYRSNGQLHRGAELPIASPDTFVQLISQLCEVYQKGRESTA